MRVAILSVLKAVYAKAFFFFNPVWPEKEKLQTPLP